MEPYQECVIEERVELGKKVVSLVTYIMSNDIFLFLPEVEQMLLRRQLYLMSEYHEVLTKRIQIFEKETT